jgi:hypothetical protein
MMPEYTYCSLGEVKEVVSKFISKENSYEIDQIANTNEMYGEVLELAERLSKAISAYEKDVNEKIELQQLKKLKEKYEPESVRCRFCQ